MPGIKQKLKDIVIATVIPEVENYLEDLHKKLEINKISDDEINTIRDLESFLVELHNIILVVDKNKITEEEATEAYNKIMKMINDH